MVAVSRCALSGGDDVNDALKELVGRSVAEPDNLAVTMRIRDLRATESDFSEELFESFDAESRRRIYLMLLLWTDRTNLQKILERRANSEPDRLCNKRLQFMIRGLKEPPLE